jgi:hypothetical protein
MRTPKCLVILATLVILVVVTMPLLAQQENSQSQSQSQPSLSPGDIRDGAPTESQRATNDRSDYDRTAGSGSSWGIPVLTLIVGIAVGYFLGLRRARAADGSSRRDHAA